MDTIRIFVGTSDDLDDLPAEIALEHSLRQYASGRIDLTWMRAGGDGPWAGWNRKRWGTPFTLFRWAIPEICNFEGRAIYMDVDQLSMADVRELWEQDIPAGKIGLARTPIRFCVMLIDCMAARDHVPSLSELRSMEKPRGIWFPAGADQAFAPLEPTWNCFDGYSDVLFRGERLAPDRIKHLHFTEMQTQPWKPKWLGVYQPQMRWSPHPRKDLVKIWEAHYRAGLKERVASR